ncbi:NAD(P)/FAD-dependent oxidoreductase [Phytoactinopolyspora halotolerans]|uniref:NAD(P)/FAD-dependent oxidoreductase n=1 Tax=Phytoactinopolyspora halotolerans TaxID=1981512 RepID=A0A6L9S480_9ACTN|nr:NAD(P)/FAD-dependent oxidoreductase [Phytoactinopolyspora halotolerans]NED99341.1 NAD(P)/FAD-dependent oxidoreductase [Phytoactinopolyspora halotolerans]
MTDDPTLRPRVLVVGAGYAGLHAARRLQSKLRPNEASITVVDPRPYMTYQPFLPETASGAIEPRHAVAPLRAMLKRCQVLTGRAIGIDLERRSVRVDVVDGNEVDIGYDLLVLAPGSASKTLPVPGLSEQAVGFTTLGEAVYLRNHVLSQLDRAASTIDPVQRNKLLTFMFVGGGYAGIEALGELENMARFAAQRYYPTLDPAEMRWMLVEAVDRIMPEVSRSLADYTVEVLRRRGIEVRMETTVDTMEGGHVTLSDGAEFDAGTVVWTTGVVAAPVIAEAEFEHDKLGRVQCTPSMQVKGVPNVFAAGDCAAIPDLTSEEEGATYPPTAQHAVRQGKLLADNIRAILRGRPVRAFAHRSSGAVATLGLHQGVAEVYGAKVRGLPAWMLHRLYHLSQMPTANRKSRVLADWVLDSMFPRQVVAIGELHRPRQEFAEQAQRRD